MKRTDLTICAVLFLATIAIYSGVLRCAFINLDDTVYVTDNPHLRAGLTPGAMKWALISFQPDNWFPLTRLSHLIDYTLFGDRSAYHHAENVLIHAFASVLLFVFLRRAIAGAWSAWAAGFVAVLFAVHPLHVESVAWISERKDVLCAFFWFAALWAWVEWVQRPALRAKSERLYFLSLGLFACGLMSKPMIVTFPVLLLLLDMWPLRRHRSLAAVFSRDAISEKLPFFGLSFCVACLTWMAQRSSGAIRSLETLGLGLRIENALITPWIYIGKTFWPTGLSIVYSWPASFPLWQAAAGGLALAVVSLVAIRYLPDRPWLAVGWFWFLITLVPVIGIVQVGEQVRADRYTYVPMVGLGLMLAGSLIELLVSRPAAIRPVAIVSCAVLTIFSALTWSQIRYWRDSETLFRHAIEEDPQNYSAWFYLGSTLWNTPGQQDNALAAFDSAVRVRPDFVEAREKLARSLCAQGREVEGLLQFEQTLRERPHYALANFDLGTALVKMGRVAEAIPPFRHAVQDNPLDVEAQIDLGVALQNRVALENLGAPEQLTEAIGHLDRAVHLDPGNVLAQLDLAMALSNVPQRFPEAVRHFEEAIAIDPDNAAAHYGLGNVLLKNPETAAQGIAQLEAAERIAPDPDLREKLDRLEHPAAADQYNSRQ